MGAIRKLFSPFVWGNLLAMVAVIVLLFIGVWKGLELYTRHGEGVPVPNVSGMMESDARYTLGRIGLVAVVVDSAYNKTQPAGCILEQTPGEGSRVKEGREIYLTVNSENTPTMPIPDIADNSSLREAEAKLKAMGFKLEDRGIAQVSMNMVNYEVTSLPVVYEMIRALAERYGTHIVGSELVGLAPAKALLDCAEFYLKLENFDYKNQVMEYHLIDMLGE